MTDYVLVLTSEFPGRQWSLSGNDPATLVFHDDGPVISGDELDALWPKVEFDSAYEQVRGARAVRYTAETDPMYWKVMRAEDGLSLQDWVDAVEQIRADLPYPTAP